MRDPFILQNIRFFFIFFFLLKTPNMEEITNVESRLHHIFLKVGKKEDQINTLKNMLIVVPTIILNFRACTKTYK